jgi:hypothetical protein
MANPHSTIGNDMKDLKEIREILLEQKQLLIDKYKVKEIGIFGSFVRGEQREKSDVDILVDFSEPVGLEFVGLCNFLDEILGMNAHVATVNA